MGESTHTAPGMLPTFPGVHAIAVAPRCRTQLHLGVKAQLTGPGYQPEQLTADVVALAVPDPQCRTAWHRGWPERARSVSRRYRPQAGVLRCLDQAVVITDDRIKVRAENASGGKVDRVQ